MLYASEQALQSANRKHLAILKRTVISFLIEIFRRLKAHFIPFYTQNVVHVACCVGTSPAARKTQSFFDFDENSVISFLIEIFPRSARAVTKIQYANNASDGSSTQ
jgi:hypothetical protein